MWDFNPPARLPNPGHIDYLDEDLGDVAFKKIHWKEAPLRDYKPLTLLKSYASWKLTGVQNGRSSSVCGHADITQFNQEAFLAGVLDNHINRQT
jgi:hypothetical protein